MVVEELLEVKGRVDSAKNGGELAS